MLALGTRYIALFSTLAVVITATSTAASACPGPEQTPSPSQADQSAVTAISRTAEVIVMGYDSGRLAVFNAAGALLGERQLDDAVTAIALDGSHRFVISADASYAGNLQRWDFTSGAVTDFQNTQLWNVKAVSLLSDDTFLVAGDIYGQAAIERFAAFGGANATPIDSTGILQFEVQISDIALSLDGQHVLAVGHFYGEYAYIARFALNGLAQGPNAVLDTPDAPAEAIWTSADGQTILTQSADGTTRSYLLLDLIGASQG